MLEGTVVAATTFSLCAHPEGERIWTQMVRQPDGSYWGSHRWFFESSECVRNPALGATAWRVLESNGGRSLRVCFSEPGSNLQPTISPSGVAANATFGCVDSALVGNLPQLSEASLARLVSPPAAGACISRRRLRLRIANPANDPIRRAAVSARSGGVKVRAKVKRVRHGLIAILNLARLPGESFTVRVRVTTLLGRHATTRRAYARCLGGSGR